MRWASAALAVVLCAQQPRLEAFRIAWGELGMDYEVRRVEGGYAYRDVEDPSCRGVVPGELVRSIRVQVSAVAGGVLDAAMELPGPQVGTSFRLRGSTDPAGRFEGWIQAGDGSHAGPVSVDLPADPRIRELGDRVVTGVVALGLLVHADTHRNDRCAPRCGR